MVLQETALRLILSAVCGAFLLVSFAPCYRSSKSAETRGFTQRQRLAQLVFLLWSLLPYRLVFGVDSFKREVMQWSTDDAHADAQSTDCPRFDRGIWRTSSFQAFATSSLLLMVLLVVCTTVFRSVHFCMDFQSEARRSGASDAVEESSVGIKKKKKVSFQLPERRCSRTTYGRITASVSAAAESIARCGISAKPQLLGGACSLVVSVLMFPHQFQHTFAWEVFEACGFKLTSDHLFASMSVFALVQLVQVAKSGSTKAHGIRDPAIRFVMGYGTFLLLLCVCSFFQTTDAFMLYIYKIYTPCAVFKKWTSFNDTNVPNVNIISMWLVENMMRFTNAALEDSTFDKAPAQIDHLIVQFSRIYGDCISVLMFATLVIVPGVLGCLC